MPSYLLFISLTEAPWSVFFATKTSPSFSFTKQFSILFYDGLLAFLWHSIVGGSFIIKKMLLIMTIILTKKTDNFNYLFSIQLSAHRVTKKISCMCVCYVL